MLNNTETIILASIFVILLVVIFRPIQSVFNLNTFPSCVLSACVSALCIIGMNRFLEGSLEIILLPYAALGITLLLISLFSFTGKHFKKAKDHLSDYTIRKNDDAQTDNKRLRRQNEKQKNKIR